MHGKGKSVVHSKSRTSSGRNTLRRCKNNKGVPDDVVLIDVDSDNFHNVIIVDVPESIREKLKGSSVLRKDKKCLLGTIICIDEDESSESSSSWRFCPSTSHNKNSANAVDDCQFVPENFSPLNLSKSKRTYSGKSSNENHYGDSDSSDYDSPDCEFMEDASGKLREQWEKANMKKFDVHNGQSGRGDRVSTSELHNCGQHEFEVENMTNQHTEANASSDEGNPSHLSSKVNVENTGSVSNNSSYCVEQGSQEVNNTHRFSPGKEKIRLAESCIPNPKPIDDTDFGCSEVNLQEEGSYFRTQYSVGTEGEGCGRENIQHTTSSSSHFSHLSDENESLDGEPSFHNIGQSDERQDSGGVMDNAIGTTGGTYYEDPTFVKPVLKNGNGRSEEEAYNDPKMMTRELSGEFVSNHQYEEQDDSFHAQDSEVANAVDGYIISEREKLKETDEYKRAIEEEWASRQRELQLQAQEAKKLRLLRKRMKAESMRIEDMERRQKQRVEEIREVQKQDEEKMNLKEQIRAEVRNELTAVEITCKSMASVLRVLGIHVGGGFHSPPSHEVRSAYKRALLKFHPDRASGSDIRQLVEAEEKFKLISRMRDRFLS